MISGLIRAFKEVIRHVLLNQGDGLAGLEALRRVRSGGLWPALGELMTGANLAPFFFFKLKQLDLLGELPSAIRDELHRSFSQNLIQNHMYRRELERLLAVFDSRMFPTVVLKGGASLLAHHHPHPAVRIMGDLDLWVPEGRRESGRQILFRLGYHLKESERFVDLFWNPEARIKLELHLALFAGWMDFEKAAALDTICWRRKRPLRPSSVSAAYTLAPQDFLFFHIFHLFTHLTRQATDFLQQIIEWAVVFPLLADQVSMARLVEEARSRHLDRFFIYYFCLLASLTNWRSLEIPPFSLRLKRQVEAHLVSLVSGARLSGFLRGRLMLLSCLRASSARAHFKLLRRLAWRDFLRLTTGDTTQLGEFLYR